MLQKNKSSYLPIILIFIISIAYLAIFHGCTSVPHINQSPYQDASQIQQECGKIFPQGTWRFVHSIQVNIAGKKRANLIGITQVDSESRSLHSVLMSIEGMVVFEANYEKQDTKVKRANPPFDSKHFANGLIQDVKFIFLPPKNKCIDAGLTNDDKYICRYRINPSRTKDIHVGRRKREWSVHLYDAGKRIRTLSAMFDNSTQKSSKLSYPEKLHLKSYTSHNNYSLKMNLIKAKQIKPKQLNTL